MKLFIQIIGFGIAFYALVLVALYVFQHKMLFFPSPGRFGDCPEMERRNARAESVKGLRYYLKTTPDPDAWIVIFHGNAGNACYRTYFLDLLAAFNTNLIIFEYPGYGKDLNAPGESIFLEQALSLIVHINTQNPQHLPIYLMGESLGTGVATFVATQTDIHGLILISPYPSIVQIAQYHYPFLPVRFLLKHTFPAHVWAGQTSTPVIAFHGSDDDIIPIHFARLQILNFKNKKELTEINNCGHNDIMDIGEKIIQGKIRSFLLDTRTLHESGNSES